MLLEMNKNKAKRLVEIASTLVLQKTHKLNFTGEEGITYVSSAWLNSIDPHYSTSGRFDPFYEVIDDNYNRGLKVAKMVALKDYTYEVVEEARNLPLGYFAETKEKKKMVSKLNKNFSAAPLRADIVDIIDEAIDYPEQFGLSGYDALYLNLMKPWIDADGTLWSHFRLAGERKAYFTPSLQQASNVLRDFLLKSTGYCDVDAKASMNYDFSYLLVMFGFDELDYKDYFLLDTFFGRHSRKHLGTKGISKLDHLATMFGSTKCRDKINKNFGEGKFEELREALEKFVGILYSKEEFADLQGFDRDFADFHYQDYGRALSRMLNRIETKKMETYANQLELMGYEVIQWCYDGLILDKELDAKDLLEVNEWFQDNNWESPLTIKKVWR